MNLEKAREIVAKHEAKDERGADACGCRWSLPEGCYADHETEYFEAKAYLECHASRDAEVKAKDEEIAALQSKAKTTIGGEYCRRIEEENSALKADLAQSEARAKAYREVCLAKCTLCGASLAEEFVDAEAAALLSTDKGRGAE